MDIFANVAPLIIMLMGLA